MNVSVKRKEKNNAYRRIRINWSIAMGINNIFKRNCSYAKRNYKFFTWNCPKLRNRTSIANVYGELLSYILIAIFVLLFVSEVVHDKFLNSRFDFYDMIASLIALGVWIGIYPAEEKESRSRLSEKRVYYNKYDPNRKRRKKDKPKIGHY